MARYITCNGANHQICITLEAASTICAAQARSVTEVDNVESDKLADTGTSPEPVNIQHTAAGNATLAAASNLALPELHPYAAHVLPPDEMQQAERDTLETPLRQFPHTETQQTLPAGPSQVQLRCTIHHCVEEICASLLQCN